MPLEIDPELARARTLPASGYVDPAWLAAEQAAVFARTWQLVGRAEQVARPGDHFPCVVAEEPLLIVRGDEGTVRALSNVCRHRAGPVACSPGQRRSFQCGYHGWTYGLDGRLLTTPEWEGVEEFDRAAHGLPVFRVEEWAGFLFVNLDPAAPALAEVLGRIPEQTAALAARGLDFARLRRVRHRDYEIACNWKVYVDNYLEGYHIPIVHPGLFQELDYAAYRVETARWYSRQDAPLRSRRENSLYQRHLPEGSPPEALYYWVFPNLMLNIYPDNLQTNLILPLGPERTLTRFEWFVPDPDRPGLAEELDSSLAFSDEVQAEDILVCEAVQQGLRSRTYAAGRFSVKREAGVHHFHRLMAEALQGRLAPG